VPPLYELTVVTPERTVYEGKVSSIVAPGSEGYLGVLARHAPMVVALAAGELKVAGEAEETRPFALAGGYLEVAWGGVTILADAAEAAEEIDIARARAAQERAQERLRSRAADVDVARAEAALRRALTRLRVAEKRPR
jgi:F-type H+-transporting ATPase subunit epsilon